MDQDYISVTEIAGDEVTQEKGERWEEQKLRRLEGERAREKSFGF